MALVPPPQQRLCKIHGIPIAPSRWRSGNRHSDCARCRNKHRSKIRNDSERNLTKSMKRRTCLQGKLRGYRVFERLTGFKIPEEWKYGKS